VGRRGRWWTGQAGWPATAGRGRGDAAGRACGQSVNQKSGAKVNRSSAVRHLPGAYGSCRVELALFKTAAKGELTCIRDSWMSAPLIVQQGNGVGAKKFAKIET